MKELEDCNDRYNFDRLLDNVNTKSMKDYKQLFDLDCLNSVLDMEQKMQLKRASDKAGNNKISSKINLTKKQKVPDTSRIVNSSHDQIVEPKWTIQENQILFKAHKILGHNWTKISSLFPSRFPRSIKAHFLEVLRCISGKFSKRPVTENDRFKGYSYQPRDETEVL